MLKNFFRMIFKKPNNSENLPKNFFHHVWMIDSDLYKLSSTDHTKTLLPAMTSGWLIHEIPSSFTDVLTVQRRWNLNWIWGINLRCFTFLWWPKVNLMACSCWVHRTFILGYRAFGQGQNFRRAECSFRFLKVKQPEFQICWETGAPTGSNNWICKDIFM